MEDRDRIRARFQKYNFVPGPGAYDPRLGIIGATSSNMSASVSTSTLFVAQNQTRGKGVIGVMNNDTMDPGMYNPETNHLANQSRSSFSKSSKSGSGGFGAKQPRTLQLDSVVNTDDPTPAPGTYSPEKSPRQLEDGHVAHG